MEKPKPHSHVRLGLIVNRLIKLSSDAHYIKPHRGFLFSIKFSLNVTHCFSTHIAHVCSLFCSLFSSFALLLVQFVYVTLVCSLFYSFVLFLRWFTLLVRRWHCQFFVLLVCRQCYWFIISATSLLVLLFVSSVDGLQVLLTCHWCYDSLMLLICQCSCWFVINVTICHQCCLLLVLLFVVGARKQLFCRVGIWSFGLS